MIASLRFRPHLAAITSCILLTASTWLHAYSPKPDLTLTGAIDALKADKDSSRLYEETYNLGPTGLRGWIYIDSDDAGYEGLQTDQSRQILITVASAPGNAALAKDDVILGAMAASTGDVPSFSTDCRKAFGLAIGDAEKIGAGNLRVKRWRAGILSYVNITLPVIGTYSNTAPYNCPKSAAILGKSIIKLNQQSLYEDWNGAIQALALLAAVPTTHPNYTAVQTKLKNFAHTLAPATLSLSGCDTWHWGYINLFLSEYYLRSVADGTPDTSVLHGLEQYTVNLAKSQSRYGTFGAGGAEPHADGSLHGTIPWYGPINSAALVANMSIVLGSKALTAGSVTLNSEIGPAIDRANKFFTYYVNKGSIPYGEHEPFQGAHSSNGKDQMAAVLFGLQLDKKVETEYFTRMSVAGFGGREYGHTGQGFSYLWSCLGTGMGGDAAVTTYFKKISWHLDLERRTDNSFVYDGTEQYGGGSTTDGSYLGESSYEGLDPTACYVLSYAMSLKRLFITGRDFNPAYQLDQTTVNSAIAAASYDRDCVTESIPNLIIALGNYDPVVRHDAATQLASRTLSTSELSTLVNLITNATLSPSINVRQAVCETLGIRQTSSALTALGQRLSDTDFWVRGKAANALRNFQSNAEPQLVPMLNAFIKNATDPDVIVWNDPIQIANGYLADTLFKALKDQTYATDKKSLLYPALEVGLKQPDGMARGYLAEFLTQKLVLSDVQAVAPALIAAVATRSQADTMFSEEIRYAGLITLAKFKIEEAVPLCLMLKEQNWHGDNLEPFQILRDVYGTAAKEVLPTLYTWKNNLPTFYADGAIGGCCPGRYDGIVSNLDSTIAALEANTPAPTLNYFKTLNSVINTRLSPSKIQLNATTTDLAKALPRFTWSKVSGPGLVSFSSNGSTASASTLATLDTPGSYVLRVSISSSSIMNAVTWWKPHRLLGYYDFQTYDKNYGTVFKDFTVVALTNNNSPPDVPSNLTGTAGDSSNSLKWNPAYGATSYRVKRATTVGGTYTTLASALTINYQDTTATNHTTYYYQVSAVNSYGESLNSSAVSVFSNYALRPIYVNLDSATVTGLVGPGGSLSQTWNQLTTLSASNLLDSSGNVTNVGFNCTASNIGRWGSPTLTLLRGAAFNWNANGAYTLTLSGLASSRKYHLFLTSFYPSETGSRALFSTSNLTTTSSPQVVDNLGANSNSSTWVEGRNYARFLNLEPDSSGQISLSIVGQDTSNNQRRAYLNGFQLIETTTPVSTYTAWAATANQRLSTGVNDSALADPDRDGIPNLVEFVLSGNPMQPSTTILPKIVSTGSTSVFAYERNNLSLPPATTQVVEYGSNLTGWTAVPIPATSLGNVTITSGTDSSHVSVALPALGAKGFVRLKITQ